MSSAPITRDWSWNVQAVLRTVGKELGMFRFISDTDTGFEESVDLKNGLRIRPDVLWKDSDGRIKVIFEIDTYSSTSYPKTIYGSMLGGIIMAKEMEAEFVEVVREGMKISRKAELIAELFNKHFKERINIIEAPDTTDIGKMSDHIVEELQRLEIIRLPSKT